MGLRLREIPGFAVAAARLFSIQSAFSYERMLGVGFGHAVEPLLRQIRARDGERRYREALARQSRFFNAHPYVTSLAVGAVARAEVDGEPPERVERLRAALCGPLGALGDRLIWAAWLPACAAVGLLLVAAGAAGTSVVVFLLMYNIVHAGLRFWGLAAGWRSGLRVAGALSQPLLQRGLEVTGPLAALSVGAALPALLWYLAGSRLPLEMVWDRVVAAAAGAVLFVLVARRVGTRFSGTVLAIWTLAGAAVVGVSWP